MIVVFLIHPSFLLSLQASGVGCIYGAEVQIKFLKVHERLELCDEKALMPGLCVIYNLFEGPFSINIVDNAIFDSTTITPGLLERLSWYH